MIGNPSTIQPTRTLTNFQPDAGKPRRPKLGVSEKQIGRGGLGCPLRSELEEEFRLMKVVCVDDSLPPHWDQWCPIAPNGTLQFGQEYTVLQSFTAKRPTIELCHIIAERPLIDRAGAPAGWRASRFVPLEYYQAEFCVKEEETESVPSLI